ncbi:hypothetical protein ES703_45369 [subsurface metagenome]
MEMCETSKIIKVPELSGLFPQPDNYEDIKADISQRSIKEPLLITPESKLICGYTRLQIAEELGIKEVPVRTEPLSDILDMQEYAIRDNYHRRQLSRLQMVEICGKRLEEIEAKRAEERMKRGKADPVDTMSRGLTRDIVGKQLGMSGRTYERWKVVNEKGSTRTKSLLEEGKINLSTALELCKLETLEQDRLIERIKNSDNPYAVSYKVMREKIWRYARKDKDGFQARKLEIEARAKGEIEIKGEPETKGGQVVKHLVEKFIDKFGLDEALRLLDFPDTDERLIAGLGLDEVWEVLVADLGLVETLNLFDSPDWPLSKLLDQDVPEVLCTICWYVRVYEKCENDFTDRWRFRRFMYPLAEKVIYNLRTDLFIDDIEHDTWEGCRDMAEWMYLDCKKFKEENEHNCYKDKNMQVVSDHNEESFSQPVCEKCG